MITENINKKTLPVNDLSENSQILETVTEFNRLPENQETGEASGISHGFDTGYAMSYGVDEAIMIRNLQFFITANANRGHNFHEGRFWTYDRLEDFPKHFPYWSVKQCRRIIESLISKKVIIVGEFNTRWSNRTCWYAFNNQSKFIKNTKPPKSVLTDLPKWANVYIVLLLSLLLSLLHPP